MFRREPDTRRVCPVCAKRIGEREERYCNHCAEDFTGSWVDVDETDSNPETFAELLSSWVGGYVHVDLVKPQEPTPKLLLDVKRDYITLSTAGRYVHLPVASVYAAIEHGGSCFVFLRHENAPSGTGGSWWVGVSVPIE